LEADFVVLQLDTIINNIEKASIAVNLSNFMKRN
jgi:hypothetical protein